MSLPKIPQTRVIKKLGLSTVVAWDLSNCISVETVAGGAVLDLSKRKVLPTHIVITDDEVDNEGGEVILPSAKLHQGRAITVINQDTNHNSTMGAPARAFDGPIADVTIPANSTEVVYSDGAAWQLLPKTP